MQRMAAASWAAALASPSGIPRAAALNGRLGALRPASALGPWRTLAAASSSSKKGANKRAASTSTARAGPAAGTSGSDHPIPAFTSHLGGKPDFDLIVIGSGPAAQGCAISSSRRGKKVAVIDKPGMLGGVCVNTGTIPSKTFREAVLHLTGACVRESLPGLLLMDDSPSSPLQTERKLTC